jgi:prevent-host-death family protein
LANWGTAGYAVTMNKPMTAAEAKAHLSTLLDRAASGQETVITRRGKPVARIAPLPPENAPKRKPGALKGILKYDNATLWAPMSEQELLEAEGDLEEFIGPKRKVAKAKRRSA